MSNWTISGREILSAGWTVNKENGNGTHLWKSDSLRMSEIRGKGAYTDVNRDGVIAMDS
ncbi:hypothetical protein OE749_00930 [Aestuariibacter sp. AA17]|uniref:Uncharacterized protein n=1 Tax=Fluctibacter corallii TaxID=2984329 RepID=A0ABT3A3K2_9ALTE|nr:hypothetical protein [Aestuariibacter sp. AA17]MCV2883257.1 hypothetical protein [Aestuariibacter sp. AA17]